MEDDSVLFKTNMALGFCYSHSDDLEKAVKFYREALQIAHNDDEKSYAVTRISLSLCRDNKTQDAIDILSKTLININDNENKVEILIGLADAYEQEKDYENKAFVLDKANELKPNDSSLMFKAGYSYTESHYDELALLHYKNARSINPKDGAVQNNLGVQYDNLGMPIKSISSYQEAEKLGETISSANLAYRLMNNGFISEAKNILDLVKSEENVHPNVNLALAEINKKREDEDKIEQDKIKLALKLRKFFLEFIGAKFVNAQNLKQTFGEWKSEKGIIFDCEILEEKIIIKWKEKMLNFDYNWKLEGKIFNNSSAIIIYEEEYDFTKQTYEYKEEGKGFLFCDLDGNVINFINIDNNNRKKIYVLVKGTNLNT